ncbi:hypothetical protein [Sorangium sp. So ce1078]|uniref:hypothetical protein n=1 Tax=Sorangium sp. So ce1078 TaxID=3133329 RepID=UPI003F6106EE
MLSPVKDAAGARVLRDGMGLATNTAYYIGARGFADAHPDLVQLFLSEVKAVGEWANENTGAAAELLAPQLGLPQAPRSRRSSGAGSAWGRSTPSSSRPSRRSRMGS